MDQTNTNNPSTWIRNTASAGSLAGKTEEVRPGIAVIDVIPDLVMCPGL
jgi:hypothetical protein